MIFGGYFICWLAVNGFNIIIYLLQSIVKKNPDFIFDGCYWYTDYLFDKGFQLPIIDSTYDYYDWIKGALDFWNTFSSWQNINGSFVAIYLGIFILGIVSIQLTSSYNAYFDIISSVKYNFSFNTYLQGFFPNRNITSAIYLTQLPFIIYIIIESKSKFLRIYSSFISFALLYMVFMLGSRTAYVILLFLTIFYLIIFFINKHEQVKKHLLVFGLSLIASLSLSLFALGSNNDAFVVNRLQTIDFEETSTNTRLRYYSHGFNQLISSPIFGVGLGNWKIVSIERDKDNIESYIIPYTMHNDFLEVGAELGLTGLLIFISIYFFALRDCWNLYNKSKNNPLFILLPGVILIYLIDANLNFPYTRSSQLFYLAVFLSISTYLNKTDESNN